MFDPKVGEKRFFIVEALDVNGNVVPLPGPVSAQIKDATTASVQVAAAPFALSALKPVNEGLVVLRAGTLAVPLTYKVPATPTGAPASLRVVETDQFGHRV